ncbi:hypothetical protein PB2503_10454 [Parvularcula bermudensis HTCC2503]|uniref:DUF1476 domain-containing protein n=1 Tax=Parvularcula bermudensis (strain ATCC BAA-594 / HTCC2503 / KCTC 12087) TaxID=314260 RepID=E0TGL0_PARBH|nr:DUF1476 domain-containing protein [Parvularcula bermudensis]ADM10142.1 hypothetical protein PB2503_10454 [Parvularcula bermudensis HTCC2503]
MTGFNDREKRFESEFAHNQELKFKIEARRDKLVGKWAADLLGLSGEDAEAYAKAVVRADLEEPGDDDVFRKLRADLDGASKKISDEEIRTKMAECLEAAINELK